MLVLGAEPLRVADVADAARHPDRVPVALDAAAVARMDASVAVKRRIVAEQQPVYGVTTGFGDSCHRQISPAKAAALQQRLWRFMAVGTGPDTPADTTRAAVIVRANCLARGASAIRPEVVRLMLNCLHHDILPVIPQRGSVGASGDLTPLSYLVAMVTGEGVVELKGERMPAAEALATQSLSPVRLEAKEALAIMNGTSYMSAFAALATADAAALAVAADLATALATEVLLANRGHLAPFIHASKPHPGQVGSAARIARLLEGSRLARDHAQVLAANARLGDAEFQVLDHPIQEKYSLRCAPQVTGVLHDTLVWVRTWVETEINATDDNPLFDDEGGVYSGGNFYGGHIGQAMDALKIAVASTADLMDRQMALVVDEKFNRGLTPNLIRRMSPEDPELGLHHGFKGMQIACSALTAEALKLAAPATVFSRSTESHNQDKVSMGTIASRDAAAVVDLARHVAAIHLLALCQAADLRGAEQLAPATRAAYDLVRQVVPFNDADRPMDDEVDAVAQLLGAGAFTPLAG